MQETLTPREGIYSKFLLKRKKRQGLIFVMVIIIIVSVLFINFSRKEEVSNLYCLSLDKTTNKNLLEQISSEADEVVGASYVYKINNVYYVVGFIYYSYDEAVKNLKQVKQYLPDSEILTIKNSSVKKSVKRKLKSDVKLNALFNENLLVKDKLLKLLKNIKNFQTDLSTYRELTKLELNLSENLKYLSSLKETGLINALKVSNAVQLSLVSQTKNDIRKSSEVIENLKVLYIKLVFEDLNLKKLLNTL